MIWVTGVMQAVTTSSRFNALAALLSGLSAVLSMTSALYGLRARLLHPQHALGAADDLLACDLAGVAAAGVIGTALHVLGNRHGLAGAARAWVRRAVGSGALSLADLQNASPATRALAAGALAPDKLGASLPACFGAGFSTRAFRDIGQI